MTFRSLGGLRGSLPYGSGILCRGFEPVNQTSGKALGPGLTVARDLELLLALSLRFRRSGRRPPEGSLGTLQAAGRRILEGADISLVDLLFSSET